VIESIAEHVEGRDNLKVTAFPIRLISRRLSETVMGRVGPLVTGREAVLVKGTCESENVDTTVRASQNGFLIGL